jgi:hypothetical protein
MIVNLDLVDADESTDTSVPLRSVPAGNLQPWMLLYLPVADEVAVVTGDPEAYQQNNEFSRTERWVRVPVFGDFEPVLRKATTLMRILVGAEPDQLAELLPEDLYDVEQEALARNGLCHEQIHHDTETEDDPDDRDDPDDEEDVPVWCALPSDPNSVARLCTTHDLVRQQESAELVARGFQPTYGTIAGD